MGAASWPLDEPVANTHSGFSRLTFPGVICVSGLYPQPSYVRRGPSHSRAVFRVEGRRMTGAEQHFSIADPLGHVAPGVRADRGVRDDAVRRACPRLGGELVLVESEQQDLVEARAGPHDLRSRIQGP